MQLTGRINIKEWCLWTIRAFVRNVIQSSHGRELKYLYQWESDEELIFVWTSFRIFKILKVTCCSFGFSLASSLKKRTESITLFSRVTCFYIFTLSRMKCKLLYTCFPFWLAFCVGSVCCGLPDYPLGIATQSWSHLVGVHYLAGSLALKCLYNASHNNVKNLANLMLHISFLNAPVNSSSAHPLLRILAGNLLTILSRGWGIWNFTTGRPFAYHMMTLLPKLTIL